MKGIYFTPSIWQSLLRVLEQYGEAQTRRLGGLKEINQEPDKWICIGKDYEAGFEDYFVFRATPEIRLAKPKYHIGETVYIKEVHYRYGWWVRDGFTKSGNQKWRFKHAPSLQTDSIGGEDFRYSDNPPDDVKPNSYRGEGWYKRSPLFMYEWMARRFIVIEQVGIGRVQEITEEDASAEGFSRDHIDGQDLMQYPLSRFCIIWNTINPKYPWESNPWVFPYTFRLKGGR